MSNNTATNGDTTNHPQAVPTLTDVIIAGGGAAGCVLAGRLAEAFPQLEILLIEEGKIAVHDPAVTQPLEYVKAAFAGNSVYRKKYVSPNGSAIGGRTIEDVAGRTLGGGTAVNAGLYSQPAASDYDDWNQPGWAFSDLAPLLHKAFRYPTAVGDIHGKDGKLDINFAKHDSGAVVAFEEGMIRSPDVPRMGDWADFKTGHGWAPLAQWINTKGQRTETATAYILGKPFSNLTILPEKTVARVIVDQGRAVAVEINDSPGQANGVAMTGATTITARRQIVLSAGTYNSPLILERSGIGSTKILKAAGVETSVELAGVGEHLINHSILMNMYYVNHDAFDGLDKTLFDEEAMAAALKQWEADGTGPYASTFIDVGIKLRPTEDEVELFSPGARAWWDKELADKPDKPLVNVFMGPGYRPPQLPVEHAVMAVVISLAYPASRGRVHLSSSDVSAEPNLDIGLLSATNADMSILLWAYKKVRNIFRQFPIVIGEHPILHPPFPESSAASPKSTALPQPIATYSEADDLVIEEWIRKTAGVANHAHGTCAMRPKEFGGVVDSKLNVYGVQYLKVADLSIAPGNLGANTAGAAVMVGEKAAEILIDEIQV